MDDPLTGSYRFDWKLSDHRHEWMILCELASKQVILANDNAFWDIDSNTRSPDNAHVTCVCVCVCVCMWVFVFVFEGKIEESQKIDSKNGYPIPTMVMTFILVLY